ADLADARAVRGIVDAVELALERRLPPAPFEAPEPISPEVSGSFRIPVEALEDDGLARLGLVGELPATAPLAPTPPPGALELPLDALAYRHGLRPAATLLVELHEEARARSLLPHSIERRLTHGRVALFA